MFVKRDKNSHCQQSVATLRALGVTVLTGGAAELRGAGLLLCPPSRRGPPPCQIGALYPWQTHFFFYFWRTKLFPIKLFLNESVDKCLSGGLGLPGGRERGARGRHPRADASRGPALQGAHPLLQEEGEPRGPRTLDTSKTKQTGRLLQGLRGPRGLQGTEPRAVSAAGSGLSHAPPGRARPAVASHSECP